MSKTAVIKGLAYGISVLEVSDEGISSLLDEIEAADDLMDIEQFADLYDDSYYDYGLISPKEGFLKLLVHGQDKTDLIDSLLERELSSVTEINFSSKTNKLVLEAYETVELKLEAEEFNPKHLTARISRVTLPNGDVKTIFNPYHNGQEFENVDTTVRTKFRIFTKNGEELEF